MQIADLAILGGSLAITFFLSRFGVARRWASAVSLRPVASLLIFLAVGSLFIGSSESGARISLSADATRIARALILGFIFTVSMFGMIVNPSRLRFAGSAAAWMVLYSLLGMFSAIYSVSPIVSIWKGFEVFSFVVMGIYIARYLTTLDDVQWLVDLTCILMLYFSASVLVSILVSPSEALPKSEATSGVMMAAARSVFPSIYPNSVTQFAALLSCLSLSQFLSKYPHTGKSILVPILFIGVLVLILGHSRTSIFAAMVAVTVILWMGRHFVAGTVVCVIATVGLLYGFADVFSSYLLRGQNVEQFLGMTGRTYYWREVWAIIAESPFIGHGFYSQRLILNVSSVDNTYLQILVGLGFVGLIVVIVPLTKVAYQLFKIRPRRNTDAQEKLVWLELVSIYIIIMTRSLTGPTFQDYNINLVLIMLVFVAVNGVVRAKQVTKTRLRSRVKTNALLNNHGSRKTLPH